MPKPTFLVTNDDGIRVYFIKALVEALSKLGTVFVAAPVREQSWVGKGVSRHRDVCVNAFDGFPGIQAWEVDGTPSDAVNIALGHLLPKSPDVVVSGINVGWNAMVPVLYSSGTVAGALEGASWGIPAVALSMHLKESDFDEVKMNTMSPPKSIRSPVDQAAALGADFSARKAGSANNSCEVYNINFPTNPNPDTPWVRTQPGRVKLGSLFEQVEPGCFSFQYSESSSLFSGSGLPYDYNVFSAGKISLSKLNFFNIS